MSPFFKTVNLKTAISKPISIEIAPREIISVAGPSGIGKSLFFRSLADLDPHDGHCVLEDLNSHEVLPQKWRQLISYLANEILWWEEIVSDHFRGDEFDSKKIQNYLSALNLKSDILQRRIDRLSSGESQRLGIIRSLLSEPKLLLLDEPFANLDEKNKDDLKSFLRDYSTENMASILIITHQDINDDTFFTRSIDFKQYSTIGAEQ